MGPCQLFKSTESILVTNTSANSDSGLLSIELALEFVQNNEKTLLIDGDLRHPTIHKHFGLKNDLGLSDILHNQQSPFSVIKSIKNNRLSVLTSGSHPVNIFDIFNTDENYETFHQFENSYDKIIIQGPSFFFKDTLSLAAIVKNVLIIIHPEDNHNETCQSLVQKFLETGTRVIGYTMHDRRFQQIDKTIHSKNLFSFDPKASQYTLSKNQFFNYFQN